MKKKTRSILEELSTVRFNDTPEHFVESRASHIIDSAINLIITYVKILIQQQPFI